MALVAYEYSDSESDIESENETNNENKQTSFCQLFSSLPQPKQAVIAPEDDNDVLLNKSKKNGIKEPIKISIPALSSYNSDEEELPKKIIIKAPEKASGLFALLPNPKCTPIGMDAIFDAKVVKQKNLIPRTVKAKPTATKRQHDSDDEEITSSNFFSFTDTTKIKSAPATVTRTLNMNVDCAKPVKDVSSKSNSFFSDMVSIAGKPVSGPQPEPVEDADAFEENAIEELCGKRKKKSKKSKINFIDINAADVMPDSREWRTKALTEETPSAAVAKGEEPSQQSRRKHQITYLAYQAKVNEQELKNQWALNRMTRKQTQAKYGF